MRPSLPVLVASCLFWTQAWALPEETWLVAIANNQGEADEVSLLYAERDAQQLAETLRMHGGLSPLRTIVLPAAKAEEVRDTVHEVNARIRELSGTRQTALVVFYSGHADAEALHLGGTRLRIEELESMLRGSAAKVRMLIVDACRSGSVTRVKGVRPAPEFEMNIRGEIASEGIAIMTSSTAGESSQESDELRGSFFTHHLVNALRGAADQNQDGNVTLAEVYTYTYAQTVRSSGRTAMLQHPTYAYDVKGKGELVLASPGAGGRAGRLRLAEATTYLVAEGREGGPLVAEVTPVRASATLALPEGTYFVQERLPTEYREYQVSITAGRELALSALPYQTIRYDQLVRRRGGERRSVRGFFLLAGARGGVLLGESHPPQLLLGHSVDLRSFTLEVRLRGATASSEGTEGLLPRRRNELGLGGAVRRVVDFSAFSVSFGLVAEAVLHRQSFNDTSANPTRQALGASFGGLFSLERHLVGGLALRAEGGPVTVLFQKEEVHVANIPGGPVTSPAPNVVGGPVRPDVGTSGLASPFTWWAAGGLVWRL